MKLAAAGLCNLGKVWESASALDFIATSDMHTRIAIRLADAPTESDHLALKTMLAEGDFDRAVLVYCDDAGPLVSGEIESWPLSRIDELAAKLAAECAAS
jgi:hypothetical protein